MQLINESDDIKKINEMFVNISPSLPERVTNSIYYNKLKYFMFNEIVSFCKEKLELKQDLLKLRVYIGEFLSEGEIVKYLDGLKNKYNNGSTQNVGIEYHIEQTRIDYGVSVFCIIKRDDIYCKKFVFRFRKNPQTGLDLSNLTAFNQPLPEDNKKDIINNISGSKAFINTEANEKGKGDTKN